MTQTDFTLTTIADQPPQQVYEAINDVGGWWAPQVNGNTTNVGDEFETIFGDIHYSKQRVTELIPGKRVVWLVIDSNLSFLQNPGEWTGKQIIFDLQPKDGKTELTFTHIGLTPQSECYSACSNAWPLYIKNSLLCMLKNGKGQPGFPPEQPCE